MATTTLSPGFTAVALKLQEAAMQHGDVKSRLRDTINDHSKEKLKDGKDQHAGDCYVDHDGDGSEGNVTYYCKNDLRQAPYSLGASQGGSVAGSIDFDSSKNVVPVTQYIPEAEDSEHYTDMEESLKTEGLYLQLPVYERFISAKTRKGASGDSFAGKGRSFPILKAEDVSAALHSIGRAGAGNYNGDTIRSNIKRIAKAKGFAVPDSLKDGKEAEVPRGTSTWKPEGVLLVESCATFCEEPRLSEAASTHYPIKLMSPGRGSSGYYPPETLKKAAEGNVFKAGTQMFWNHDTDAEESARPEGDLNRLAAVTTTDAKWHENGHDGPGLYANAKVFADYADKVKEMGPHIGLSIRAGGDRNESAIAPDGKPRVITALKNAASVDFVTKAGRDGKIFTESATHEGEDMDEAQVLKIVERANAPLIAENKALREMLAATRGPALINKHLAGIRLPDTVKAKITEALSPAIPLTEAGAVDDAKLKTMVEASATEWAGILQGLGHNINPASFGKKITEAELIPIAEAMDAEREQVVEGLSNLFVGPKLLKGSQDETVRQLRKEARKAFREGRAA